MIFSFIISFIVGFIYPVFFHSEEMYFPRYVPSEGNLGSDLYATFTMVNGGVLPYPPLAIIIFRLFSLLPINIAFKIITTISLILLFLLCFLIIPKTSKNNNIFVSTFIFITLLTSYGFQFELQRGQWNFICIFLIYFSLLLFKNGNKNLSVVFFSLAVHLKVYPLIFIILFIDDFSSVKKNIIHILKIVMFNLVLVLLIGVDVHIKFLKNIFEFANLPYMWKGNHSISSFVSMVNDNILNIHYLSQGLYLIYFICLLIVLVISFRMKLHFYNKYVLFLLTVGTLIIPSVSHDYTLPLITLALLYFILNSKTIFKAGFGAIYMGLISIIFFTHYSYTNYMGLFEYFFLNKFLLLFSSALLVTCLCIKEYREFSKEIFKQKRNIL